MARLVGALRQAQVGKFRHAGPRQQNVVRDLLKSQGKFVITSVIRPNTTRRNYGLFSIFESRAFGLRLVVLGVGGEFIPLQGDNSDEVTRKLGQMILTPTR